MPSKRCYFVIKAEAASAAPALKIFCSILHRNRCLHRIWDTTIFRGLSHTGFPVLNGAKRNVISFGKFALRIAQCNSHFMDRHIIHLVHIMHPMSVFVKCVCFHSLPFCRYVAVNNIMRKKTAHRMDFCKPPISIIYAVFCSLPSSGRSAFCFLSSAFRSPCRLIFAL